MKWSEVREQFPDRWVLIEAVEAHTIDRQRYLDKVIVLEQFSDWESGWDYSEAWEDQFPNREYYLVHTKAEVIEIEEVFWTGIRR